MDKQNKKHLVGDYFKQLSIVVLGIVITFLGSGVINKISERQ